MKISIIGLGLIGGSLAKTIKKNTSHTVYGFDTNDAAMNLALNDIDGVASKKKIGESDVVFVCLHPSATIEYIRQNADVFSKKTIVCDVCGVKSEIVKNTETLLLEKGVTFIGTHPMAGREFSGYEYSLDNLFDNAYFIITPTDKTPQDKTRLIENLAYEMSFKKVVISTCKEHDAIIAYTSQLAHVVSNAYVKSPSLLKERGFSAGSFLDLTRVARLNEDMWTELFLMNREPLLFEIEKIIDNLKEYEKAIKNSDSKYLKKLLKDGRELKEQSLKSTD